MRFELIWDSGEIEVRCANRRQFRSFPRVVESKESVAHSDEKKSSVHESVKEREQHCGRDYALHVLLQDALIRKDTLCG